MTTGWNGRWSVVTGERSCVAFLHLLRAATIAAVASSCAAMDQSDPDTGDAAMSPTSGEAYAPPEVKRLTEEERARFEEFLAKEGYRDVQFMTIVHTEDGQEQLTALDLYGSGLKEFKIDEGEFLIPPVGVDFGQAIVAYTGSPADLTGCSRSGTSTGGTKYRSCVGSR